MEGLALEPGFTDDTADPEALVDGLIPLEDRDFRTGQTDDTLPDGRTITEADLDDEMVPVERTAVPEEIAELYGFDAKVD